MTYDSITEDSREKVRSHLLTNNIVDKDSFVDYLSEIV